MSNFPHSTFRIINHTFLTLSVRLFFLTAAYFFFSSCDRNALFDSGKTTTREIIIQHPISAFNVHSIFDISLVQDTMNKVLVTCGENLQSFVDIYSKGDSVFLEQHTKDNWSRNYEKIKLEIHINQSFYINIWAPVNLSTSGMLNIENFTVLDWGIFSELNVDLNVNSCTIVNSPEHFGLFKARGKSNSTFLWNRGSCKFFMDSLVNQSCYVKQGGWGGMYVNVKDNLTVSLEFTGNVFYTGEPSQIIIEKQSSTGRLIKD
jgi:hypothetical protein